MGYTQTITFNQALAGTVSNECLENVRKGFSIDSSLTYPNATASWNISQVQHTDRNVPSGLYTPLYYSYPVDGVDLGHVNVQFPDGTVWSDGNKYVNIDAYLLNHAPKYLGWGEKVNGIAVIQEGEEMPNSGDAVNFIRAQKGNDTYNPTQDEIDAAMLIPFSTWVYTLAFVNGGDVTNFAKDGITTTTSQSYKQLAYFAASKVNQTATTLNPGLYEVE